VLSSVLSSLTSIPLVSSLSGRRQRIVVSIGASLVIVLVGCACVALTPSALYFLRREPYAWASAMSLQSVSMVSATEGWALASEPVWAHDRSHTSGSGTVFLHYVAGTWKRAGDPLPIAARSSYPGAALVMVSATDGWATAEDQTLHYDGTSWREVTALSHLDLAGGSSIAVTSPNDVWITGGTLYNAIVHYDGRTWTNTVPSYRHGPPFMQPAVQLQAISFASPSDGWAAGLRADGSGSILFRYLHGRWEQQVSLPGGILNIKMRSATDGWAVGDSGVIYRCVNGRWTKVNSPVDHPLYDIAIASAEDAWAVGIGGELVHYYHGAWQQETRVVWSKQAQDEWT